MVRIKSHPRDHPMDTYIFMHVYMYIWSGLSPILGTIPWIRIYLCMCICIHISLCKNVWWWWWWWCLVKKDYNEGVTKSNPTQRCRPAKGIPLSRVRIIPPPRNHSMKIYIINISIHICIYIYIYMYQHTFTYINSYIYIYIPLGRVGINPPPWDHSMKVPSVE
jgi:hypothetical protein